MADLYSVIAGIEPDQQDILEAELLAKQILEAKFPDVDLREGTAIRDLVLRPSAFLLAICRRGLDYYFSQNSLSGITNDSPQQVVDNLLGNLFLTRNTGTFAIINCRLYFARDNTVSLTTSTSFSTNGVLQFFPVISTTYPPSAFTYDSYSNEYYIDVDMMASEKGPEYNLSSGSLLYFTNFSPFFLHGEINYLSVASIAPETNLEFIDRAKNAISTRNLINKPSIQFRLNQDFNYLTRMVVVGAGEDEMHRDQVLVAGYTAPSRLATSMALSDSDTKMTVVLSNHGLIVGQLITLVESAAPTLTFKRVPVDVVVDVNTFKVITPVTVAPRSFAAPHISKVEEDIYVHQGGDVDIYCGDALTSEVRQFTTDANGKFSIQGPVLKITRSSTPPVGSSNDTIPNNASYTTSFDNYTTRADIQISQSSGKVVVNIPNHCLTLGRLVELNNWPAVGAPTRLFVTEVTNEDQVKLGRNLPTYTVSPGLTPYIRYIDPARDTILSTRQILNVDFRGTQANKTASFEVQFFDRLDSVQEYLSDSENRIVCADYLARGFDVYLLDIALEVYDTTAPSTGEMKIIVEEFLDTLKPGQDFILADLAAYITDKGFSKLKTPINVTYKLYTKDGFAPAGVSPLDGVITDTLFPFNSMSIFKLNSLTTATLPVY